MRKFHWMLALSLLTVLALSGCHTTTPPEDLQPVPEALDDPSGANGTGLNSNGGDGFGPGSGAEGGREGENPPLREGGSFRRDDEG